MSEFLEQEKLRGQSQDTKILSGTDELLKKADQFNLITPDGKAVDLWRLNGNRLNIEWLQHPMTKRLLLALHVLRQEQLNTAENNSENTNAEVRHSLIKAKTLEKLITYVNQERIEDTVLPRL